MGLATAEQTRALGERIGHWIRAHPQGLIIHLLGDLGSGKTCLARAVLRTLGIEGPIKSPTYTLVESYVAEIPGGIDLRQNLSLYCYHFDFYRFTDPREWLDAGFREYFDDHALCLVEWPERAAGSQHWTRADLEIRLELDGAGRVAHLGANSPRGSACLAAAASLVPGSEP
ncbi:MAG: tRNA (adenosine(37)-N6)-threonylcarbamoyltransferase complex ATPase subunit type 1 TsaE [Burkholderiaceae bacterium]|jgi:tRNA threonylcarbamoyladenosine biosynthesis protein TsaE